MPKDFEFADLSFVAPILTHCQLYTPAVWPRWQIFLRHSPDLCPLGGLSLLRRTLNVTGPCYHPTEQLLHPLWRRVRP